MMARTRKLVPPAKSRGVLVVASVDQELEVTSQFVEFEGEGNGKEEELVADCDEEGDGEVVIVQGVYFGHGGWRLYRMRHEQFALSQCHCSDLYILSGPVSCRHSIELRTQLRRNGGW